MIIVDLKDLRSGREWLIALKSFKLREEEKDKIEAQLTEDKTFVVPSKETKVEKENESKLWLTDFTKYKK